jgi:UDP-glucose 4-epimerase
MKILVTGASGYIGQHLCLSLMREGWQVRGLSRSPMPGQLNGVEWVQADLLDRQALQQALIGCEAVVHLACLPLVDSQRDPMRAFDVNVNGTLQVLDTAQKVGVRRVVFTSTGQVYNGHGPLPNQETDLPQPDGAYAVGKWTAEEWCRVYSRRFGLEVKVLRLFNVYGPALDGSPRPTVETLFIRRLIGGLAPIIRSHPDEGRDFIHVQDVVRAICSVLTVILPQKHEVINIGSGRMTTLIELASLARQVTGSSLEAVVEFAPGQQPVQYQADPRKAANLLGFSAQISLEEGLKEIYEHEIALKGATLK